MLRQPLLFVLLGVEPAFGLGLRCDRVARTVPIRVRLGGATSGQGTAWFVDERHVVTALHVVGSVEHDAWAHELDDQRTYDLGDDRPLAPVVKSATLDLAVLRADSPQLTADAVPLAPAVQRGGAWYTIGFPGFYADEFALTGMIANVSHTIGARTIQLQVDQGTNVDWAGISGSPVIGAAGAVGVITNVTDAAATAWAAPVAALRSLLAEAGVTLPGEVAARDVRRELVELRLAAEAALASDSADVRRIRSALVHELEMCRIHESRIEFFAKQLQTPYASFTPYFEEEHERHSRELRAALDRVRALLVRDASA